MALNQIDGSAENLLINLGLKFLVGVGKEENILA